MRVCFAPCICGLAFLALGALGCGDDPPTYPPVNIYIGTSGGTGNTGTGNTGNNTGNTGNGGPGQGGDDTGGSNNGGRSTNGGSGNTLYPHCGEMWSEELPASKTKCDLDALTDGGEISGDITKDKTLEGNKFYTLKGSVRVMPGVTLTIKACTKIIGKDSTSVLAVRAGDLGDPFAACTYTGNNAKPGPGGKLIAVGEVNAPIIFTSANPPGKRHPGDWGGLMMMGNARENKASRGYRVAAEGLTKSECFGWHTDEFNDESSGDLEYVRVEYASRQIALDNETNNITFAALGHGTKLSHIMSSNSGDDCFEWFGGTADADHLIALNCEDDMFDTDDGFSGKVQFAFGRQWPTTTETDSSGFESDTGVMAAQPFDPVTTAKFSNFSICGAGNKTGSIRPGAAMRARTEQTLLNGFITQFESGAVRIVNDGRPQGGGIRAWDNPSDSPLLYDPTGSSTSSNLDLSPEPPDRFCGCSGNPPSPIGASTIEGKAPTFGDKDATYVGAFKDSTPDSNWMRGSWADFASE